MVEIVNSQHNFQKTLKTKKNMQTFEIVENSDANCMIFRSFFEIVSCFDMIKNICMEHYLNRELVMHFFGFLISSSCLISFFEQLLNTSKVFQILFLKNWGHILVSFLSYFKKIHSTFRLDSKCLWIFSNEKQYH